MVWNPYQIHIACIRFPIGFQKHQHYWVTLFGKVNHKSNWCRARASNLTDRLNDKRRILAQKAASEGLKAIFFSAEVGAALAASYFVSATLVGASFRRLLPPLRRSFRPLVTLQKRAVDQNEFFMQSYFKCTHLKRAWSLYFRMEAGNLIWGPGLPNL